MQDPGNKFLLRYLPIFAASFLTSFKLFRVEFYITEYATFSSATPNVEELVLAGSLQMLVSNGGLLSVTEDFSPSAGNPRLKYLRSPAALRRAANFASLHTLELRDLVLGPELLCPRLIEGYMSPPSDASSFQRTVIIQRKV